MDGICKNTTTEPLICLIFFQAQPSSTIEPGIPLDLNITLVNNATGGNYTIRARTDRNYNVSFPNSINIGADGSAQGTITLIAPSGTDSGTDVTLTIEAESPESGDSNYLALRFTVMTKVAIMISADKLEETSL